MKYLVVNADDFGYTSSINRGIIEGHKNGIITSTSVMVYESGANETSNLKNFPDLSVGLHFDIENKENDVDKEFERQLEMFIDLYGGSPDHIDTHKMMPSDNAKVERILRRYAKENKVPIRGLGYAEFVDDFFGMNVSGTKIYKEETVTADSLLVILKKLSEGVSELMCHAGYSSDELRSISSYSDIRETELTSLTSPEVLDYINTSEDIKLVNWKTAPIKT